ncbi:MAG: retropepsin-like aspartic protease [Xenococcaceae cyanobacterium MO_207.B15]|nr:retropepsin-like aspartic protease [Xenococcaceae cyanobacterium MO_207.B15]
MNKISKLILLSISFSLIPYNISAQQESGCFMLDSNGNPRDLGHLCGESNFKSRTQSITNPRQVAPNNSEPDVFVVPIKRREGGTPVIDVKFNDRYLFEMLVDTGATWTVITSQMAKTLKVKPQQSLTFQTPSSSSVEFDIAQVPSVETGGMVSEDLYIAIAPSLEIGLLGQNFYQMYDITIKYGVIEFRPR